MINTTSEKLPHPDCAANGGPTISRVRGCINDEMLECIVCRHSVVWDLTENSFFGFKGSCPYKELIHD
jgi:hypothetical protein